MSHAKILKMVQLAFLAAIEVVLTLIVIQVGTISLNFGLVPIIIAGIFLGPVSGMIIGAVSGIVTMIQVLSGQSAFYVFLLSVNPAIAALLCVVKTALAGLLAGLVYQLLSKVSKLKPLNVAVAAAVCPIVNTGVFALGMLTIFGNALMADATFSALADNLVALVFVVLIGVNFFVELVSSVVICPILSTALFSTKMFKDKK